MPSDGSAPAVKLNHALVAGGDVLALAPGFGTVEVGYLFSPDGARVVYRADQGAGSAVIPELYGVPSDGSAPAVKLNGTLLPHRQPVERDIQISADGAWVLYRASENTNGFIQLWRAPLDGSSAPVELNGPLGHTSDGSGHSVDSFLLTPDGTRALYVADSEIPGDTQHEELWSVPLDRSAPPVKLSGAMVVGGGVSPNSYPVSFGAGLDSYQNGYRVTADGWCVYKADARTAGIDEVYRVPIDGSAAPVLLSGDLRVLTFGITADRTRVVAFAFPGSGSGNLYGIPLAGGAPLALKQPQYYFGDFRLSSKGNGVLYHAGGSIVYALSAVPADGSAAPTLLTDGIQVASPAFEWTPDGKHALFLPDVGSSSSASNLYLYTLGLARWSGERSARR